MEKLFITALTSSKDIPVEILLQVYVHGIKSDCLTFLSVIVSVRMARRRSTVHSDLFPKDDNSDQKTEHVSTTYNECFSIVQEHIETHS